MTDPKRLLDGEGSEFERELLSTLARERPGRALSRRMRQSLLAVGVLTSAKTGLAGFVALAGVVSLGVGGGWLALRHPSQPSPPAAVSSVPAVTHIALTEPTSAPPAASTPMAAESAPPPEAPVAAPAPRPSAAPGSARDLREQIAWLDRVRVAVRAGDGTSALAELSQYPRKFPRGEFAQEVTVLKVEALVQNGQLAAARSLGNKFVNAHPESPHVERIQRLIGTPP